MCTTLPLSFFCCCRTFQVSQVLMSRMMRLTHQSPRLKSISKKSPHRMPQVRFFGTSRMRTTYRRRFLIGRAPRSRRGTIPKSPSSRATFLNPRSSAPVIPRARRRAPGMRPGETGIRSMTLPATSRTTRSKRRGRGLPGATRGSRPARRSSASLLARVARPAGLTLFNAPSNRLISAPSLLDPDPAPAWAPVLFELLQSQAQPPATQVQVPVGAAVRWDLPGNRVAAQ